MIDGWHLDNLVCPIHRADLVPAAGGGAEIQALSCGEGCRFPVVHGVAVMLPRTPFQATHENALASIREAADPTGSGLALNSLPDNDRIDGWVQKMVAHTNSTLYAHLVGRLAHYPIPSLPIEFPGGNPTLLDIGCGWGRWSLAAARMGFSPVGIDTSLKAALAATRVAAQLGLSARYVVADSRFMPFRAASFDAAWSYSVLQHFAKRDVIATLDGLKPLMRPGGVSKLHLLNSIGLRSLLLQLGRGFREARGFETRYWHIGEMLRTFERHLGPSRIELDGFFVQGRHEDRLLFRPRHRLIVDIAHALARIARWFPALRYLADNIYVVTRH
jgi:hypothetical protein